MSEIKFVEIDAETINSELIQDFEIFTGETLPPADARRIFLQSFTYVLVSILNAINTTGVSELLRYAHGDILDELGNLYGVARLQPQRAVVNVKFTLSALQPSGLVIAKGTRVTPDGTLFFRTIEDAVFTGEELEKIVECEAMETGSEYNGYTAGQINKLVDGNPYVKSVVNVNTSNGGSDIEDDDSYRERIQLSPFAYSTAGPEMAYRHFALSASTEIGSINVYSPAPCKVEIVVLKNGGVIPEAEDEVINLIYEACNEKTRRPLTDQVTVKPAKAKETTITVEYWINKSDLSEASKIQADVTQAVEDYKLWQTGEIARNINPDELRRLMLNAGAKRVTVTSPIYTEVARDEVAQFTATNVTYKGTLES